MVAHDLVSTFGRILPAYLDYRFGAFIVMTPMTLLGGIFALALWLPVRSILLIITYAVLCIKRQRSVLI